MLPDFYGVNIGLPQSAYHNQPGWPLSQVGQLNKQTDGNVYIEEIPQSYVGAMYCWRVVGAKWSFEDTTMTRFRAFGPDGEHLPHATFGVSWAGCEQRISGGFRFPPKGNLWYQPIDGMNTPNTGGYMVIVLDQNYPSEGLAFGCLKTEDGHHQALVIDFQLLPIDPAYPNDFDVGV